MSTDGAGDRLETRLLAAGRHPAAHEGIVNPPVYHASTIVHPTLDALEHANSTPYEGTRYGRFGTPTTFALEEAVAVLEGGYRSIAVPSGLSAITTTLLALVQSGDHVLVADTVYGPTRRFCDTVLAGFGVQVEYHDPLADITPLLRENTRCVFVESPGSLTFEVQDVAAISAAAHTVGAVVAVDSTWAAGLLFRPLDHGADISIQAATKYIVGHSDAMLGLITTTEAAFLKIKRCASALGTHAAPDDCYLALRGLRTLATRLARHGQAALALVDWLVGQPAVKTVLHPSLQDCPGHGIWQRDFSGCNGLLSIVLEPRSRRALAAMLDGMRLFAMGYSWGGYESLIVPFDPHQVRTATRWPLEGPCLRLHAGLDHIDDLVADLAAGLGRYTAST